MNENSKRRFALSSVFGLGTITVFFIVLAHVAIACSQLPQKSTTIEAQVDENLLSQQKSCLDQNCLFVLEKNQYDSFFSLKRTDTEGVGYSEQSIENVNIEGKTVNISFDSFYQNGKYPIDKVAFVEAIDKLVENDISDIKPILFQEIEIWTKEGMRLSPYEQSEESKLIKEKNQLLDCNYTEYKRVGSWLVENSTRRDYCYETGGGGGMCSSTVISYPKFLAFLLSDINGTTAPYLAVFIFIIVSTVAFATYLIRRKELWFFLRPRKTKIVVTIAGILLSLSFSTAISGIGKSLGYIFVVYLIASLIGYIRLRLKAKPKVD